MTHFGKIKIYDGDRGRGTISPESGGEPLEFVRADLQLNAAEPRFGQRYGYETRQVGGGKPQAIKLRREQGQREPAEHQQG